MLGDHRRRAVADAARRFAGGGPHKVLLNKYYVDEIYDALIVWPIWALWHLPLFWVVDSFRDFGVGGILSLLSGGQLARDRLALVAQRGLEPHRL